MSESRGVTRIGVAACVSIAVSLFLVFFVAREADDAMGGQLQRIFYVHVPSAWAAYLAFAVTFTGSVAYLRTSNRTWDLLAHSSAEIGIVFTTIVLVTGPIWARPVWGTWWQWDARLTSTFVMFLTYLGYLFLRALSTDPSRTGRVAAVVGIVGLINVPIVHFSVQWWRTLHPSGPTPVDLAESSGLGSPELTAFFASLIAITLLYAWLLVVRVRLGRLADRIEELEIEQARAPRGRQPSALGEPAPTA
jgi:heme exporter protein C